MKHSLTALCLLLAGLLLAVLPTDAEADIYRDTLRLHILAASDAGEDQSIKLSVRDHLLSTYGERLGSYTSVTEAEAALRQYLPEMEESVNVFLATLGVSYGATLTLAEETYDTRHYADVALPRGTYTSLRVILGEGEGHNWWCVMFPPMCLDLSLSDAEGLLTDEEMRLIGTGRYSVKFKLLELLSGLFDP